MASVKQTIEEFGDDAVLWEVAAGLFSRLYCRYSFLTGVIQNTKEGIGPAKKRSKKVV